MGLSSYWENLFYTDKKGFKKYIPRPIFWIVHFVMDPFDRNIVHYQFKWLNLIFFSLRYKFSKKNFCVGWLLCGNENTPSSRIHGINIHKYLLGERINSVICYGTNSYSEELHLNRLSQWFLLNSGLNVLIFQKTYRGIAGDFLKKCNKSGIKAVLIISDYPVSYEMSSLGVYDHIIVSSKYFKYILSSNGLDESKISVIEDAIETPRSLCKDYNKVENGPVIKVVWVGYELTRPQQQALEVVREALRDNSLANYELVVISKGDNADVEWDLKTVWAEILKCDIAVIPSDMSKTGYLIKSNNRSTMFKALGLPVICSPIPAYRDIIKNGENGFFAETLADWIRCLDILKDVKVRERIGLADREKIFSSYGIEVIGEKYLRLLRMLYETGNRCSS